MAEKTTKVITRRRKFISVEIPLIRSKIDLIGESPEELDDKTIKLDLTRQLKGKSIEAVVQIKIEGGKAVAYPKQIKLMPYFIRRMIRKRISYIEDSIQLPSQESLLIVKPFLITRKRVSRAVRKALRNRCKNWLEDYLAERTDEEIFREVLSNKMQKPLSLTLKKTYPLSLCEIRILDRKRPLKPEEVPKIERKKEFSPRLEEGEIIDQFAEIEEDKKRKGLESEKLEENLEKPLDVLEAEQEIKAAQKKASEIEEKNEEELEELSEKQKKKKSAKKTVKKIESKEE